MCLVITSQKVPLVWRRRDYEWQVKYEILHSILGLILDSFECRCTYLDPYLKEWMVLQVEDMVAILVVIHISWAVFVSFYDTKTENKQNSEMQVTDIYSYYWIGQTIFSHFFHSVLFYIFTLSFIFFLYLFSPVSTLIIHPLLLSYRFTYALPIIPSCILQPSIQFVIYNLHLFSKICPFTFSQTSVLESLHLSIVPSPLLYSADIKFLH